MFLWWVRLEINILPFRPRFFIKVNQIQIVLENKSLQDWTNQKQITINNRFKVDIIKIELGHTLVYIYFITDATKLRCIKASNYINCAENSDSLYMDPRVKNSVWWTFPLAA